jgi:hypothetical protein
MSQYATAGSTVLSVCETTSAVFRWMMYVLHPFTHHLFYSDILQDESARSNIHSQILAGEDLVYQPCLPPDSVPSPSALDLGYGTGRFITDLLDDHYREWTVNITHSLPDHPRGIPTIC